MAFETKNMLLFKTQKIISFEFNSRFTAYSYMIQEQCQGIPSQEKTKYEKELSQCVKSKIIPTDLKPLSKIVTQMVKPIISQHVVKKQTGKTCLSVQRIKVCSKISKDEVHEPKPIKVQRKLIQYVCVDAPSVEAQSLEQRAKAGEQLGKYSNKMSEVTVFRVFRKNLKLPQL